jgi:hypothetical protein
MVFVHHTSARASVAALKKWFPSVGSAVTE